MKSTQNRWLSSIMILAPSTRKRQHRGQAAKALTEKTAGRRPKGGPLSTSQLKEGVYLWRTGCLAYAEHWRRGNRRGGGDHRRGQR